MDHFITQLLFILADVLDVERILSGQSGVALGLLLGGILSFLGFRFYSTAFSARIESLIESNAANVEATNRLCRAVANVLIESRLKVMRDAGKEIVDELTSNK